MRSWIAFLALLPACGFNSSGNGDDSGLEDAMPDAPACFGSMTSVCFLSATDVPTAPVVIAANTEIDTDASPMCDQHNTRMGDYCVVAAGGIGFTIAALTTVRAYGSKPLVLLSTTSFTLLGVLDVSSNSGAGIHPTGAGANPGPGCTGGTAPTGNSGGHGGTLGGQGGDGEDRDGSRGGAATPAAIELTALRGGCRGSAGNSIVGNATPGAGGSGGGAIAVIAATIDINGTINASGAGGRGGSADRSGGGGGGSGGMIVLDAPTITLQPSGVLFANGGGGGQGGAGSGNGGTQATGQVGGESTAPGVAATRGSGADGGDGGDGSFGANKAGSTAVGGSVRDGGGGAGGGGGGVIRAHGVMGEHVAPASDPP